MAFVGAMSGSSSRIGIEDCSDARSSISFFDRLTYRTQAVSVQMGQIHFSPLWTDLDPNSRTAPSPLRTEGILTTAPQPKLSGPSTAGASRMDLRARREGTTDIIAFFP